MAKKLKDLAVFIGRFSPFHKGHAEVLTRALDNYKAVVVLVGSAGQARTTKNPFTFEERRKMIYWFVEDAYGEDSPQEANLRILPIYDYPYNDQAWIRGVQDAVDQAKNSLVDVIGMNPDVYITGANRDRTTWYLNAFGDAFIPDPVSKTDVGLDLSATQVRDVLFNSHAKGYHLVDKVPSSTLDFLVDFAKTETYEDLVKEYKYLQDYKASMKDSDIPSASKQSTRASSNLGMFLLWFATTFLAVVSGVCLVDTLTWTEMNGSLMPLFGN